MKIFVYGTLAKKMSRSSALDNSRFDGPGFINADLYDLGHYPAILDGHHRVIGEIYSVSKDVLRNLDQIEGHYLDDTENSLYVRKTTKVTMFNDRATQLVEAYFYNAPIDISKLILCGDYRRFCIEQSADIYWYIAYGSNMKSQRLAKRIGVFGQSIAGYLDGYQLVFNKNGGHGTAYANIVYRGKGNRCPCVAYRITQNQLDILDGYEGEPNDYMRVVMPFHNLMTGETNLGYIYIANPHRLTDKNIVAKDYMNLIIEGYKEHNFDPSMVVLEKAYN